MPVITVKLVERTFSLEQQQRLIHEITDVFARVSSEGIRPTTVVLIEEIKSGLWGSGGEILTVEGLAARRAAREKAQQEKNVVPER